LSYVNTTIAGYTLTYNPESIVWDAPSDVTEQRLTGRGQSTAFYGGTFYDTISFDGMVTPSDLTQLLAIRDLKRIVTLVGDMVGQRFPVTQTVFVLIEDIAFNEQAGFTDNYQRYYPYKFRLRKVGDADHWSRCTVAQTSYIPHAFSQAFKPVVGLPTGCTSLSQSKFDTYVKLLAHMDGTPGSTTFIDSSYMAHTVTANGSAYIGQQTTLGPTSTGVAGTVNIGDTNIEGSTNNNNANQIFALGKFVTSAPYLVNAFTLYQNAAGSGHMHFGIYQDNGGTPAGGALVSGSDSGAVTLSASTGWITYSYTTPFALPAGTYWLITLGDTSISSFYKYYNGAAGTAYYATQTYGALPATYPSTVGQTYGPYSAYYVSSIPVQGYIKGYKFQYGGVTGDTIETLNFYTAANSSNFRLALYNDNGGSPSKPNQLLWSCGDQTPSAGNWVTVQRASGTDANSWNHTLTNGAWYWLCWQWSSTTAGPSYTIGTSNYGIYLAQSYGSFPSTWSGGTNSSEQWSEYAQTTTAKFNQYLWLDGSTAYLSSASSTDWYFGTSNFTVDFWFNFASLTNAMIFAGQYQDSNNYWYLKKDTHANGDVLSMVFVYGGMTEGSVVMTSAWSSPAANTWYHLAFVRSGSTAYIFINGQSQTLTVNTSFSTNDVGQLTAALVIGEQNSGSYCYGAMDEFRLSNGAARWTANFSIPTSAYLYSYRTGQDGQIPYVPNFVGNQLYYSIPEANMDLNNVLISRSGDQLCLSNGLVKIWSRNNQTTNQGNLDLYYYDASQTAWVLIGQLELLVYDYQWNSMSGQYCTISPLSGDAQDDPEYCSLYGVWQATANDCAILVEIETFRGKPYFAIRLTNAGTAVINGVACRVNINSSWGSQFRYFTHGSTTEDAQSAALGSPEEELAAGDDYPYSYLATTSPIGYGTIETGIICRTRAARTYAAYDNASGATNYWQYVDMRFYNTPNFTTLGSGTSLTNWNGTIYGQQVVPTATGLVTAIGIQTSAADTGNFVLGIYADNGSGYPGTLLTQTAQTSLAKGWNVINLVTPIIVNAGTPYWIAGLSNSSNNYLYYASTGGVGYSKAQSYSATMPSTFPASGSSNVYNWNLIYGGAGGTPITTGQDLEYFWVFARYYENGDDAPSELAKECVSPVDQTQDMTKVS
jgi:hypothetical protein